MVALITKKLEEAKAPPPEPEPPSDKWTPDKKYKKDLSRFFLHRRKAWALADIQFFTYDLLWWSEGDDAITLSAWAFEYGLTLNTLDDWYKQHPCFREAYDLTMERIGQRREEKALAGVYNAQLIAKFLPVYNSKYKDFIKWQAEVTKEIEHSLNGGKQYIVLEKFGESKDGESGNRDSVKAGKVSAKKLSDTNH